MRMLCLKRLNLNIISIMLVLRLKENELSVPPHNRAWYYNKLFAASLSKEGIREYLMEV